MHITIRKAFMSYLGFKTFARLHTLTRELELLLQIIVAFNISVAWYT